MRIVLAGASGFLGRHLARALIGRGDTVLTLARRPSRTDSEYKWEPDIGVLPIAALDGADVVVNLCGAGVGDRRWTARRTALLRASRVRPTALLAGACAAVGVPTLINASAVGIYGNRGDTAMTEESPPGIGFLARLCVDWEAACEPAAAAGTRVVRLRTGLVLGPDGGMLPRLVMLTRLGLGGRLGSGRQWWPWISVVDHVAATLFLIDSQVAGPVNMSAPHPVRNADFTAALGAAVQRPTPWAIPGFALHAALGGFAAEVLGGQRVVPKVLEQAGFTFLHADLAAALRMFTTVRN